jgi:hypothetical protein
MAAYIVESTFYELVHGAQISKGVVGEGPGSQKLYLHVLALEDAELKKLKARVDENGNKEHDRLALPDNDEWWIATEGTKAWPKTVRPKLVSRVAFEGGVPKPQPLSDEDRATLSKLGVKLP